MHSGLQSKLVQYIKQIVLKDEKYTKQFFFATHSTNFIDFRGSCSHYICEKSKGKFSIELLEREKKNKLKNILGLSPSSLLQWNGIIWVEGPSDPFYIDMLFKCFGIDLDYENVTIKPYYGIDNILGRSEHISPEFLKSFNENFIVIMDSDKKKPNLQPSGRRINAKKKFQNAGHLFWLIEHCCDIEGIIPQSVLNEVFNINLNDNDDNLKKPYEKLDKYIDRVRLKGLVDQDIPGYKKMKCAPLISRIILKNDEFRVDLRENEDLRDILEKMSQEIRTWTQGSFKFDYSNLFTENNIKFDQLTKWLESFHGTNDSGKKDDLIRAITPYTKKLNQAFSDYTRQGNIVRANVSSETLKIIDPSFKDHRTIFENPDGTKFYAYGNDKKNNEKY